MKLNTLGARCRTLANFFAAQGSTLAANVLYGLLCVRLLPSSEYAKYVVVFAVQNTIIALMDVNLTGTLVPIVGERNHDRRLIADYVASLRHLSHWAYGLVAGGLIITYPLLVSNRGWDWSEVVSMIAILLFSTFFMRLSATYGAVLILLRERSHWYRAQLVSSIGTLALLLLMWWTSTIGAFPAILLNVLGIVYVATSYRRRARRLLGPAGQSTRNRRQEILRLALPNMPHAVFWATQGQVGLFLITYFGRTNGVASVGALGRLSQLFALLLQVHPVITDPYFARLPERLLRRRYIGAFTIVGLLCTAIAASASAYPQLFLWLLGDQYRGLEVEVKLAVASGAIGCFSGVLWGIHSARRFVYWWNVTFSVLLILVTQIVCAITLDMSAIKGVLLLGLFTNLATLLSNILCGVWGFAKGPRGLERPMRTPSAGIEAIQKPAAQPSA